MSSIACMAIKKPNSKYFANVAVSIDAVV